jgi:hypothetical protein
MKVDKKIFARNANWSFDKNIPKNFDNSSKDTLIFCLNKKFKINHFDCFKR